MDGEETDAAQQCAVKSALQRSRGSDRFVAAHCRSNSAVSSVSRVDRSSYRMTSSSGCPLAAGEVNNRKTRIAPGVVNVEDDVEADESASDAR